MYFSLERWEEDKAVLCGDDGRTVVAAREALPTQAKAGDVFFQKDGCYCYDESETAQRKSRIWQLEQLLRNKK